jgi:hypothetical protein
MSFVLLCESLSLSLSVFFHEIPCHFGKELEFFIVFFPHLS